MYSKRKTQLTLLWNCWVFHCMVICRSMDSLVKSKPKRLWKDFWKESNTCTSKASCTEILSWKILWWKRTHKIQTKSYLSLLMWVWLNTGSKRNIYTWDAVLLDTWLLKFWKSSQQMRSKLIIQNAISSLWELFSTYCNFLYDSGCSKSQCLRAKRYRKWWRRTVNVKLTLRVKTLDFWVMRENTCLRPCWIKTRKQEFLHKKH